MQEASSDHEAAILRSWHANASFWARAIQSQSIASRKLVTDRAIVDAVRSVRPRRLLDVGCGEGWLARAVSASGVEVLGIDAVPALIAEARRLSPGRFEVCPYETLVHLASSYGSFDAVVCNFSLLGRHSVETLLAAVGGCLSTAGHLIVQTLHPVTACGVQAYRDGWRAGSWTGFSPEFRDPPPWYFRTLSSWYAMLRRCGFDMIECREPTLGDAAAPSSIIFVCGPGCIGTDVAAGI